VKNLKLHYFNICDWYDVFILNCKGKYFSGSREELIEYMTSVGYKHFPDGHKVWHCSKMYNVAFKQIKQLFIKNNNEKLRKSVIICVLVCS
jgi:hypothetical protein